MPENKHRNPFEDHINSESFDVSNLGSVQERSAQDAKIDAFLESFPNLDEDLWHDELDTQQKEISAYLATVLSKRILQDNHNEALEDVQETELRHLLMVPMTLAMLAERRLHDVEPPPQEKAIPHTVQSYRDDFSELPANWGDILSDMVTDLLIKAKDFIISLFRRS